MLRDYLHKHHLFFRHKEINTVYLSVFLLNLADSMISIFVPIYLYSLHYAITTIIFFSLLGNLSSVLLALPFASLVAKLGGRLSILASTPFLLAYYIGLKFFPNYQFLFWALPICIAIHCLFYNFGFELNFIKHTDSQKVGRAISTVQILAVAGSVISPLVAGLFAVLYGFKWLFVFGSVLLVCSAVPLFFHREKRKSIYFAGGDVVRLIIGKPQRALNLSFTGYAIESSVGRVIWPLFLIIILGTAEKVGYAVAASTFLTVLTLSYAGRLSDRVGSGRLIRLGTLFYFFGWVGSAFVDSSISAYFAELYRRVSERFLIVPWGAAFYHSIPATRYFCHIVARDLMFNLSRVIILPLFILVFYFNFYPFAISFIAAAFFTLFYVFAGKHQSIIGAASSG